jgi:hypothetical protein
VATPTAQEVAPKDKKKIQSPVSRSRKPKPSRARHTTPRKECNPKMLSNRGVLAWSLVGICLSGASWGTED